MPTRALAPFLLATSLGCLPEEAAPTDHPARRAAYHAALEAELGAAWAAPVPGVDGADAAQGAEVFTKSCAACHGATGDGKGPRAGALDPKPAALDRSPLTEAGWYAVLQRGSPQTSMAPWGTRLSEGQLLAVLKHLRTLRAPPR